MIPFELSTNLGHTWFIDLDGTILNHNGYINGNDCLLPGVKELWAAIPEDDYIIITTGREEVYKESSLKILTDNGLRYDHAIFGLPLGERIVVNDLKPEGLKTAIAWNVKRNLGF
jgi:hydroxymethylpyrimidine pyrophosphatase-like HAD family hydrolase